MALLDLYWHERVLGSGGKRDAPSRQAVLREVVTAMSRDRVLHVDQDVVESVATGPHLYDLLYEQVLVEWKPQPESTPRNSTLVFAHHVLFDYAVARLLLRRDVGRLVAFLVADPAFVLLGRPSLVMHFHYLWALDQPSGTREAFWEAVLAVCDPTEIPEIGKLIGPGVAAEIGVTVQEYEPLLVALADPEESVRTSAENALAYCVRALLRERGSQAEAFGLLCDLAGRLSNLPTIGCAYPASWILWKLTTEVQLSARLRGQLGAASRRLLVFAWDQSQGHAGLLGRTMRCVCRMIGTDARASSELLRRAIAPDHLTRRGGEELSVLADAIVPLAAQDPDLVRDIYLAAFGYAETSETTTFIRRGVLSLTSNRRQDHQSTLYRLVQSYPAFLRAAPRQAVEAMNAALEHYVTIRHSPPEGDAVEFDLDGARARLLADHSRIWDRGQAHPHQHAIQLLDCVQRQLEEFADQRGGAARIADLLDALLRTSQLAVVWRRLLGSGARHPNRIGMRIRAVGWSLPVLMCPDTIRDVGRLNAAVFLDLPETERAKIERSILAIPEDAVPAHRDWAERIRDRMLGCLPGEGLVTAESRTRMSELNAADAIPENEDGITFQFGTQAVDEAELLAEEGVPVDEEPNRRVRALERPVTDFADAHLNEAPESRRLAEVFPHLTELNSALRSSEADGVHERQADVAWGSLAAACAAIAKMETLRCHEDEGAFVRTVLLEASTNRAPTVAIDADERFVDPSWGSPAARVEAAAGLMRILRHPSCDDSDVVAAIERLIADPAPSVRYQVASRLMVRYADDPEWTCRMMEQMARDRSIGVLRGLVERSLCFLKAKEPERASRIAIGIRQAVADKPDRKKLTNSCADVLLGLFVWGRDDTACAVIDGIADDPVAHLEEVGHLLHSFRDILVAGPVDPCDPEADAARRRSWGFLLRVAKGAAAGFQRGVERQGKTHRATGGSNEEQTKGLAVVLDSVGWSLYSASGAKDDDTRHGEQVLRRFYTESRGVFDVLADVGLPHLSHRLLEALEVLIPIDPRGVFSQVARVILGGRKGAYEYDSLAEEVIVGIVDRYLADHRDLFQRDEQSRQHLIAVLDTFVRAGSESAWRLSFGLDGIFR
ncbi:MAG: hypothetical protein OXK74_10370 [Gemmatimonadota bacterium]|nr:hypothetical protein [Gemmatimonadota bacterium]